MKKYYILAFTFLCLLIGQSSFGQLKNPDAFLDANTGDFNFNLNLSSNNNENETKKREALEAIANLHPAGLVNLQTGEPTANVNINFVVSSTSETSSNSSISTSSTTWGVNYLSLTSVQATSSCWLCDLVDVDMNNSYSNNTPVSTQNNLPNSVSIATSDSSTLSYYWDHSNNNLNVYYIYTSSSPLFDYQEYEDKLHSKVRADLDRGKHPYDYIEEVITPSGVELRYPGSTGPSIKIDLSGNVKIIAMDGTYKSPSELNANDKGERRRLAMLAAYLGRSDASLEMLNKGITIVSERGDDLSSNNPAWTRSTQISFNRNGGFSTSLNNVNNFKSILKHEINHVDDNKIIGFESTLSTHADVYIRTAKHDTYKNTTVDFRKGNAASFANYLLNMDTTNDATITQDIIANKIIEFNKNNAKIKVEYYDYYMQKGGLKLVIRYDNEPASGMIIKTPINE